MKTQATLLRDMLEKAKSLGYAIKNTELYVEFYKDGIMYANFRKFSADYTIADTEYNQQMAKIK